MRRGSAPAYPHVADILKYAEIDYSKASGETPATSFQTALQFFVTGIARCGAIRDDSGIPDFRPDSGRTAAHPAELLPGVHLMTRAVSLALVIGGVLLLYFGGQSLHSFGNEVSKLFTGSPTDKTIWLLVGGAVATVAGLIGLAASGRQ
jgi:hypothetical protein